MELSDINEVVDRSIYLALYNVLVYNNYTPDRELYDTKVSYDNKLEEIISEKGFAIELFGYGSNESKDSKRVPRIVYNSLFYLSGTIGNPPNGIVERIDDNYKLVTNQSRTSDLIIEIYLVSNSAKQDRILHSIVAAAIRDRGYIKFYNDENKEFYIEQVGERVDPELREGMIEKVYLFKADDLYQTNPIISSDIISPIKEVNVTKDINLNLK